MNNQPWQSNQNWNNFYQPQLSTNITYVMSSDEALMRSNQRNSEYVYFNQDKPEFYRVKVDSEGRKMWQSFNYNTPNPELNVPVVKGDLIDIVNRIMKLEKLIENSSNVEVNNGEPNG